MSRVTDWSHCQYPCVELEDGLVIVTEKCLLPHHNNHAAPCGRSR